MKPGKFITTHIAGSIYIASNFNGLQPGPIQQWPARPVTWDVMQHMSNFNFNRTSATLRAVIGGLHHETW